MDIYQHIAQFWLAVLDILRNIVFAVVTTTEKLDDIQFKNTVFTEWLGYVKYVIGTPLYTMFMTVITISIGITIYKIFLRGVFLVKELLIKIGK